MANRVEFKNRPDVLIVGGGPSGLRVAARLAAGGLDVRVLEKKSRVGENVVCTGIVGREVFDDFGLDRASIIREVQTVRLVSPRDTVLTYQHPRPFAYVVDREQFDGRIAAAARSAGAAVDLETRVDHLLVTSEGVEATARTNGRGAVGYLAKMAVIASGVDSVLQKKAGLSSPRHFLKGAQAEVPARGSDITSIFFGREVAPGAFAWSVPAGEGKLRVGLLTREDPVSALRRFLFRACPAAAEGPEPCPIRTRAIAQGLLARTTGDRILSVGEAAGQIKTTTGGGISYGLLCADLASETILDCFRAGQHGAAALAVYESRWRKALQKEIVVGHTTRRMCARLTDDQIEGLFHLAQTDGIIPIIRERADFDWHSGLIAALLQRLSFMSVFRAMKDSLGFGN